MKVASSIKRRPLLQATGRHPDVAQTLIRRQIIDKSIVALEIYR